MKQAYTCAKLTNVLKLSSVVTRVTARLDVEQPGTTTRSMNDEVCYGVLLVLQKHLTWTVGAHPLRFSMGAQV